jgi:beta-ureidopropionase
MVKAALIQMQVEYEKEQNVLRAERLIRSAAAEGAQLICLQELFNTVYFPFEIDPKYFEMAESIPGPTMERMQAIAREEGVGLIAPIFERTIEGLYFNSAAAIGKDGVVVGIYRKSSIPLISTSSMRGFEKYYFAPGDSGFQVFDTGVGVSVGILICYDRHFPEAARALALAGAQVIVIPTATSGNSRALWEIELRGHAVANLCFVGGVNRVGLESGGGPAHWYGSSLWVGPEGETLCQAGDTGEQVLIADLDLARLSRLRADWGFYRDRRPDLYQSLAATRSQSVRIDYADR